ncbi:metalloregulator ArsR/SmtB family transcription factor [Intrasporangium sp. YIM S08009]|uniref:ArsR/SmtB family transcription factor n=1 Tax=Intrasporangium zincisolvens TaxID=3080018 RepID=UPI002B05CFBC|nr:metalloregulator ArsR/SmtB family transcription factor [Intrasporangium sp. YIM S08009]
MILSPVSEADLDRAFAALADPVRRAIIARLSRGAATVNELAEPFSISKQAVSKHIQVLETAGLVSRTRDAQRRPVHLEAARLEALTAWIDRYRLVAEQRFRSLDAVLARTQSSTDSTTSSTDSTITPNHQDTTEEHQK